MAWECIAMGFLISIPGTVTFKKAKTIQAVTREIPLDYLVVETDCPFLTPTPFRGKRNEPAYVQYTAGKVAELKGLSPDEIARVTTENARRLFRLKE
jgi:TatD DNase family protein